MLLGVVALVLLIACANVAHLLLACDEDLRKEVALRSVLGAWPRRLLRQLLSESVLLALLGGAGGLTLDHLGLRALVAAFPAAVPRLEEVSLDLPVLAFCLAVSLLTGLVFGLAPALWSAGRSCVRPSTPRDVPSRRAADGAPLWWWGRHRSLRSILASFGVEAPILGSPGAPAPSLSPLGLRSGRLVSCHPSAAPSCASGTCCSPRVPVTPEADGHRTGSRPFPADNGWRSSTMGKRARPGTRGERKNLFIELDAGEYVFREGTSGTSIFLIESGEIEILKSSDRGEGLTLPLGPGSFFGEATTLDSGMHVVSARAASPSRLLKIDVAFLEEIIVRKPHVAVAMLLDFAERIRDLYGLATE